MHSNNIDVATIGKQGSLRSPYRFLLRILEQPAASTALSCTDMSSRRPVFELCNPRLFQLCDRLLSS